MHPTRTPTPRAARTARSVCLLLLAALAGGCAAPASVAWPTPAPLGPASTTQRALVRTGGAAAPGAAGAATGGALVLPACTLSANGATTTVDLQMGWALQHGFVPARVAAALGAVDLGWVDLGGADPAGRGSRDLGLLSLHGLNQSRTTRFRAVRIDRVDLGVGPPFGPVAALVLPETDGDAGSVGAAWLSFCPVGSRRETFVDAAAENVIYWLPAPG